MTDRPTPQTDAEVTSYFEKKHPPIVCYHELAKFARRLERERDEAREATEKAKAFKRVMKEDNAKLRRERDDALDDHRFLLREIFNLTQIGDPHRADLPMRALKAIAEIIDQQWKGQSK